MIKVRSGMFETNSSSEHCFCINSSTETQMFPKYEFYIRDNGSVSIWDDDLSFDRGPFEILFSVFSKAKYAIAYYQEERFDEIQDIFARAYNATNPEIKFTKFDMPHDWKDRDVIDYGYIDHQSIGVLPMFLDMEGITIEEFITNPKYVIVIDGDECRFFDRYKKNGLLTSLERII